MAVISESIYMDTDDVFTNTMCLFQKYDGSSISGGSTSSRSSKSSRGSDSGYKTARSNNRTYRLDSDLDMESNPVLARDTGTRRRSSGRQYRKLSRDSHDTPLDTRQYESKNTELCTLCGSTSKELQPLYKSRFLTTFVCTRCFEASNSKRYTSVSPGYRQGSWKRRLRAERSTDIDMSPLLDVLERIDRIDTSMRIPQSAYEKRLQLISGDTYSSHKMMFDSIYLNNNNNRKLDTNDNLIETSKTVPKDAYKSKSKDADDNDGVAKLDSCNNVIQENAYSETIPIEASKAGNTLLNRYQENTTHNTKPSIRANEDRHVNSNMDHMNANTISNQLSKHDDSTNKNVKDNKNKSYDRSNSPLQSKLCEESENQNVSRGSDAEFENLFKEAEHYNNQSYNDQTTINNINNAKYDTNRRPSYSRNKFGNRRRSIPSENSIECNIPKAIATEKNRSNSMEEQSSDTEHLQAVARYRRNSKRRLSKGQLELRMRTENRNLKDQKLIKYEENRGNSTRDIQFKRVSSYGSELSADTNSEKTNNSIKKSEGRTDYLSSQSTSSQLNKVSAHNNERFKERRGSKCSQNKIKGNSRSEENIEKDTQTSMDTNNATSNRVLINIESIPCSYEEFNNDLEKESALEDNKRSSIRHVTSTTDEEIDVIQTPSDSRRGSVSQMKAFWEQQLGSQIASVTKDAGLVENTRSGKCEATQLTVDKNEVTNECNSENLPDDVTTIEHDTETIQDVSFEQLSEDESFNRIQNKLRNLPRTSTRKNFRRKSSLKNTDFINRFVNESRGLGSMDMPEVPDILLGKKKTVESFAMKHGGACSTESATDEDERFRRIQSKLMSRQTIRRKSILKNKNVTSSFLNEFLTVPAARTRTTDSESGSSSAPNIIVKRRVSFQHVCVRSPSYSSSSSVESSCDDSDGDVTNTHKDTESGSGRVVDEVKTAETNKLSSENKTDGSINTCSNRNLNSIARKPSSALGNVNVAKENAENEHLVWRNDDDSMKTHTKGKVDFNGVEEDTLGKLPCNQTNVRGQSSKDSANNNESPQTPYHTSGLQPLKNSRSTTDPNSDTKLTFADKAINRGECTDRTCVTNPKGQINRSLPGALSSTNTHAKFIKVQTDRPENSYIKSECTQLTPKPCDETFRIGKSRQSNSKTLDNNDDFSADLTIVGETTRRRRPRAKLFSIAGEDEPDETTNLLSVPVILDSSDSSDVELSWRTRGYDADFYMSRKSVTGSELINRFKEVIKRKRSKDKITK